MTTAKDFPEEATEEPRILSPEEDAERARKRMEVSADITDADEAWALADPKNPLRVPGELSTKPKELLDRDRARAKAPAGPTRR